MIQNYGFIQNLLEFNNPILYQQAITFKSYQQEIMAKNRAYSINQECNENLFEFGQQVIDFYYYEFFVNENLPNKEHKYFSSFSKIHQLRQELLNDKNLAQIAINLGLREKIKISINNNQNSINNQKIQAQAFKAIIGAQYFDKNKDLNKLKNSIYPLFKEMINSQCNQNFPTQIIKSNPKGDFQEYISQHPELKYQVIYETEKNILIDQPNTIHKFQLQFTNMLQPIIKQGEQKKEVEKQLYLEAIKQIKNQNQQFINETQDINNSKVPGQIRNNLKFDTQLQEIDSILMQISNQNFQNQKARQT
ncbi:unnamed protein product [Paramecium primaurelia]|uniref:RNase III domain-containing protein n=1 Tax=Paramecium primaurelia TaxID=5886 RepID=A0A8S1KLM9_PARPR|nr:unnamed protein product [Paramecium primaurelia]